MGLTKFNLEETFFFASTMLLYIPTLMINFSSLEKRFIPMGFIGDSRDVLYISYITLRISKKH